MKYDSECVGKQAITLSISACNLVQYPSNGNTYSSSVEGADNQYKQHEVSFHSLTWGCTIHKVQGKTLDKIIVNIKGKGTFMPSIYVALSQVKNLNGLFLLGFDASPIQVNPSVHRGRNRLWQVWHQTPN